MKPKRPIQSKVSKAARAKTALKAAAKPSANSTRRPKAQTAKVKQRILYLQALLPNPCSGVIACYFIEPVPGGGNLTLTANPKLPYATVHDAVIDGWQIVQFPLQSAPISDREVDIPGYQFILQKLEVYRD